MKVHTSLSRLSDNELVRRLERIGSSERELLVEMLRFLVEVERFAARLHPKREIRDRVKPVYVRTELEVVSEGRSDKGTSSGAGRAGCLESTGYGDTFTPRGETEEQGVGFEERYELRFTVDAACMDEIGRLRALLSSGLTGKIV